MADSLVHYGMRRCIDVFLSILWSAVILQAQPALQEPPDTLYRANPRYWERCAAWEADTMKSATIVMLGNSITEGAQWSDLLARSDVANRGIGSDNTYGYLHRMQFVTRLRPRVCFIMGGINDLYAGFTPETVVRNVSAILDTLRAFGIIPVVQSTLFASPKWHSAREKNILVGSVNDLLRSVCMARGVPFLDLNRHLSADSLLRDEYTTDGIHLSPAAYSLWAGEIRSFLRRHGMD